ncbi:MAG: hypothetical protein ACM3MD_01065 [Betaproteobacteria bacterium]
MIVNRPVNTSGLTGLLFTTAPYTLDPGTVEIAASILSENSTVPDFTMTEYPLSVTVGLPHNSELAIRGSYINLKEGPTSTAVTERKTGDVVISYKWNFLPQSESSIRPAFSLIIAGSIPTENNTDMKIDAVNHWGMLIGLSTGTELSWREHILGIYADAQLKGQDPSEKRLRDIYEIINAGLVFPISKYQNLQMLLEYTLVHGRERITIEGGDYSSLTYGLRLVSERFNLTIGTQFLRKQVEGYDDADRVIGLMSMKF